MRQFRDVAQHHVSWAMAALQWTADQAWAATPRDILLAHDGWLRLHGFSPATLCTTADLNELMKNFPDG